MATVPYAHITRRPVIAQPVVAPVAVTPRRQINPLIPICCLGLILFLIASTIVLALIPVYLTTRGNIVSLQTVPFTVLYRINNGTLPVGELTSGNCDTIGQDERTFVASNKGVSPSVPIVTNCAVTGNTTVTRRRRQAGQPEGNLITVNGNLPGARFCRGGGCLIRRAETFISLLLGRGTFFLTFAGANGTQFVFSITIISASISPPVTVSSTGSGATSSAALNNDIAILNYALILEHLEQFFYTTYQNNFTRADFVAAGFSNETYTYFTLIQNHEDTHVRVLTSVISQLGGTPTTTCTYNFSNVVDVKSYVATAAVLENTGAMAYTGAANGISDPTLRELAATIATVEARQAAYLNQLNGLVPFPTIFENAMDPATILQTAQSAFIVSCPFTIVVPTVPYIGSTSFNGTPPTTNDTSISPYTNAMYTNDLRALNFALVAEQLESTYYNTFVDNFTQAQFDAAGFPMTTRMYFILIREYEQAHADFLRTTIVQRGGTPVPFCSYHYGNITDVLSFVQMAQLFENTGARAYDGAINTISDPNLIRGAATISTVEARFASFLNGILGDVPFPDTFEQALQPAQVVVLVSPFQTCPFTPDLPVVLTPSTLNVNLNV